MKTDIFHLQIIPIKDILLHEEIDNLRALPLSEKMKKDTFLANPIIVAPIDSDKFLELDGKNRVSAFEILGYQSILAQIVDYNDQENVELSSWTHLFTYNQKVFWQSIAKLNSLTVTKGKGNEIGHRYIKEEGEERLCTIINKNYDIYNIKINGNLLEKIERLNTIVSLYCQKIVRDVLPYHPNKNDVDMLFREHRGTNLMIIFPTFTRHQIIEIVRAGKYLPPGVSRHIIKKRCLNVNVPLSLFEGKISIREQNERLERLLKKRQFRLYEEQTIYFE